MPRVCVGEPGALELGVETLHPLVGLRDVRDVHQRADRAPELELGELLRL
jgi:hypothetical protein